MKVPEFTSLDAVLDYVEAVRRVTGVFHKELTQIRNLARANAWLAKRWDSYYTTEGKRTILIEFTTLRLTNNSVNPRRNT